jgi:hypothetical protein
MKQTAVEWLVKHLSERGYIQAPSFGHSIIDKAIEQAKEMEKEQIEDAYAYGYADGFDDVKYDDEPKGAEQYYNETYESK